MCFNYNKDEQRRWGFWAGLVVYNKEWVSWRQSKGFKGDSFVAVKGDKELVKVVLVHLEGNGKGFPNDRLECCYWKGVECEYIA